MSIIAKFQFQPRDISKQYCVYTHSIWNVDREEIFFVAACAYTEILRSPGARYNEKWGEMMECHHNFILTIVSLHSTMSQAYNHVNTLIDLYKPHCNINGKMVERKSGRVRCIETGIIYPNASRAAKANAVSTAAISNHLNGKTGYRTTRGLTFERIDE